MLSPQRGEGANCTSRIPAQFLDCLKHSERARIVPVRNRRTTRAFPLIKNNRKAGKLVCPQPEAMRGYFDELRLDLTVQVLDLGWIQLPDNLGEIRLCRRIRDDQPKAFRAFRQGLRRNLI